MLINLLIIINVILERTLTGNCFRDMKATVKIQDMNPLLCALKKAHKWIQDIEVGDEMKM